MVTRVATVAFQGIEMVDVDVQVQISNGLPYFGVVGLPDKAVAESRDRVRSAFHALGLALPPKRIIINLAPADVAKEGAHYDLPIAMALLAAIDVLPADEVAGYVAMGELALDGTIGAVAGVLPASVHAAANDLGLVCSATLGSEAAWGGNPKIVAAPDLLALINHFKGTQLLGRPQAKLAAKPPGQANLADVKGQETAKRALEIAAAGGHNLLMTGPPGAGKSMLASRLPSLLPPLSSTEALEVSMIHSVAGLLQEEGLVQHRPYRDPHHSASLPALVGGGMKAKPGEISLAHRGVLFLDELPEFNRNTLEALRQPIETGKAVVARANHHVTYPARFQLVAAMNPCRCGYLGNPELACNRAPRCAPEYQSKISGPLLDRIDIHIEVEGLKVAELSRIALGERSETVAARVAAAREIQSRRATMVKEGSPAITNCEASGEFLNAIAQPDDEGQALLNRATEQFHLSARGYYRVLRLARTLADLDGSDAVRKVHLAEAISFRRPLTTRVVA